MTTPSETISERDEIELLLPWFATGRLADADRARVETWLARDAGLAFQLDLIREDQAAATEAAEAASLPRTLTVEHTMARLEAGRGPLERLSDWVRGFFAAPSPAAVRWAAAAAAVVIVAQSALLGTLVSQRPGGSYETASGSGAVQADGTFALVRFADGAAMKDIAEALTGLDMRIVDGPRPGGLFRVRLGAAGLDAPAREARASALRSKSAIVQLVLPAPAAEEKRP